MVDAALLVSRSQIIQATSPEKSMWSLPRDNNNARHGKRGNRRIGWERQVPTASRPAQPQHRLGALGSPEGPPALHRLAHVIVGARFLSITFECRCLSAKYAADSQAPSFPRLRFQPL